MAIRKGEGGVQDSAAVEVIPEWTLKHGLVGPQELSGLRSEGRGTRTCLALLASSELHMSGTVSDLVAVTARHIAQFWAQARS